MDLNPVEQTQLEDLNQIRSVKRWVITSFVTVVVLAASLFLTAGTLFWWQAWIYLLTAAFILLLDYIVLVPISPDLLGERSRYQKGAKNWDQILSRLMATIGPLIILIVSGLDFRNAWSSEIPAAIIVLAMELVLLGGLLALWAMAANRFFIGMVRIQNERGHRVISSGPYQYVRHPGYLGSIFYIFFTPLALGSFWGVLPAFIIVGVIILRTFLEDRTLMEELDGYEAYSKKVRYRIIPGIW